MPPSEPQEKEVTTERSDESYAAQGAARQHQFEAVEDEDAVDVVIDDVDPVAYRPHQIEGMILSLMSGSGRASLASLRRDAVAYMELLRLHYVQHARDAGLTTANVNPLISDGPSPRSATAQNPSLQLPLVDAEIAAQDDGGQAWWDQVDRLMYDRHMTHDDANRELWRLWNPYASSAPATGNSEDGSFFGTSLLRSERTDALSFPASSDKKDGRPRHGCGTLSLTGQLVRKYLNAETGETSQTLVYAGDAPPKVGEVLLGDPHGVLKFGPFPGAVFDMNAYAEQLRALLGRPSGTKVRARPPGREVLRPVHGADAVQGVVKSSSEVEVPQARTTVDGIDASSPVRALLSCSGWLFFDGDGDGDGADDITRVWQHADVAVLFPAPSHLAANYDDGADALAAAVATLLPGVAGRVAVLEPRELRDAVLSMTQAEKLIRRRFMSSGDDPAFTERDDAAALRDLIERNVGSLTHEENTTSVSLGRREDAKHNATRRKKTKRGGEAAGPEPLDIYVDALGLRYRPLESLDSDFDDVNRALFLRCLTPDRGTLEHLSTYASRLSSLQQQQQRQKPSSKRGGGGGDSDAAGAGDTVDGIVDECAPFVRQQCRPVNLHEMALRGFGGEGTDTNEDTNGACFRVADTGTGLFTHFLYAPVTVGPFGEGFVVRTLARNTPQCLRSAWERRRTELEESTRAANASERNFDYGASSRGVWRDVRTVTMHAALRRFSPLTIWPPFRGLRVDAADAGGASGSEQPLLQLTFEDVGHYAPMSRPVAEAHQPSREAWSGDPRDDDSFLTFFIDGSAAAASGGDDSDAAIMQIARAVGAVKDVTTAAEGGETGAPRRVLDDRLGALAKLRNPPERAAYETRRQIAVLKERRNEIAERVEKRTAGERVDYAKLEQRLVDRIRRQTGAAQRRRELVTATALVLLATRAHRYHQPKQPTRQSRQSRQPRQRGGGGAETATTVRKEKHAATEAIEADAAEAIRVANEVLLAQTGANTSGDEREQDRLAISRADVAEEEAAIRRLIAQRRRGGERRRGDTDDDDVLLVEMLLGDERPRSSTASAETPVWEGFRPRIPSAEQLRHQPAALTTTYAVAAAKTPAAKMVARLNDFVAERVRDGGDEEHHSNGGKARKRVRASSAIEKKARRLMTAATTSASARKVASACCLSRITDDVDHYDIYDDALLRFVTVVTTTEQQPYDDDEGERPVHVRHKAALPFASYPDTSSVGRLSTDRRTMVDFLAVGDANANADANAGIHAARTDADLLLLLRPSLRHFVASNPGLSGDAALAKLASASESSSDQGAAVAQAAGQVLGSTRACWFDEVTPKAAIPAAVAEIVWNNLIDITTSTGSDASREDASAILSAFLVGALRPTLQSAANPAAALRKAGTARARWAHVTRAHDEVLGLYERVAKLEPAAAREKYTEGVLPEALHLYTEGVRQVHLAAAERHALPLWASCAVHGRVLCSVFQHLLRDASKANETSETSEASDISRALVRFLAHELVARYRFAHADVRFDELISEQREAEKRRLIDLYEQMTDEEHEELKMYKERANFDQRYLEDFIRDRRRTGGVTAKHNDADQNQLDQIPTTTTEEVEVIDLGREGDAASSSGSDDEEGYMRDDDNEDTEYERDDRDADDLD